MYIQQALCLTAYGKYGTYGCFLRRFPRKWEGQSCPSVLSRRIFFHKKKKAYPPVFSGVLPSFPACTQAFPCGTPFLHVQEILLHKTLRGRDFVPDAHIHHVPVSCAFLFNTFLVPAFPVHYIEVEPACRIVTRL